MQVISGQYGPFRSCIPEICSKQFSRELGTKKTVSWKSQILDGSYQGRNICFCLWPSPHRRPNLTKYEQICRKSKIQRILSNTLEN